MTRLLYIEDEPDNALLVNRLVRGMGLEMELAADGLSGLKLARTKRHALILLDLSLPELDGWSIARALRDEPGIAPIIALTAHAMRGEEDTARQAGCVDVLTKPLDLDALRTAIALHLPPVAVG